MVYVHVAGHARYRHLELTAEEQRTLARLSRKGLSGDALAAALTGEGIEPERAKTLAELVRMRRAAAAPLVLVTAIVAFGAAFALGTGRVPLRDWLHAHAPGWEWLASLVIPLVFLLFMFVRFNARRRSSEVSPSEPTRPDAIENRPIE
jgi:hypothetical protein